MQPTTVPVPEVLISGNRAEFKDQILGFIKAGQTEIHLDLNNTRYIDASGLGVLVTLQKQLVAMGGKLTLVNFHDENLRVLFQLTALDTLFNIQPPTDGG